MSRTITETHAVIDAPHFYCGIILWDDRVVETAPIVRYMSKQRWTRQKVRDYCAQKGWKVSVVTEAKRTVD